MPTTMDKRFYGLYRGFVIDNKDPEHQGRLKVAVPGVYGNDSESGEPLVSAWALPKWAMCGTDWGTQFIPPVKNPDGTKVFVWVEFESGDQKKPVWSGCFMKPKELHKPMQDVFPEKPYGAYCIVTPRKNRFYIDDNDDKGVMELEDRLKQYFRMSSKDEKKFIEFQDIHKNIMTTDEKGIIIKDKYQNQIVMNESGILVKDKNGNTITMDSSGIKISDKNGNTTTMNSGGITENSPIAYVETAPTIDMN